MLEDPLKPEVAGWDNRRVAVTFGAAAGAPAETTSDERRTTEQGPLPVFFRLFPVELGFTAPFDFLSPGFPMVGSLSFFFGLTIHVTERRTHGFLN